MGHERLRTADMKKTNKKNKEELLIWKTASKSSLEPFRLPQLHAAMMVIWGSRPVFLGPGRRSSSSSDACGPASLSLLAACQLNCSDHGHCDSFTKRCVCDPFWMENFIKVQLRDGDSNCGELPALTVPAGSALTVALS